MGNGTGYSVQEVIDTARAVTGRDIPLLEGERRPGDPARLVADSSRAREHLGWAPRYGALETITPGPARGAAGSAPAFGLWALAGTPARSVQERLALMLGASGCGEGARI